MEAAAGGGGGGFGGRGGGGGASNNFQTLDGQLGTLLTRVETTDDPPTIAAREEFQDSCKSLTDALAKWEDLKKSDLAALKISVPPPVTGMPACGQ